MSRRLVELRPTHSVKLPRKAALAAAVILRITCTRASPNSPHSRLRILPVAEVFRSATSISVRRASSLPDPPLTRELFREGTRAGNGTLSGLSCRAHRTPFEMVVPPGRQILVDLRELFRGEGEAEMSTFSRPLPAWMRSSGGRCSRPKPSDHSCLRTVLLQGNRRTSGEAFSHRRGDYAEGCKSLHLTAKEAVSRNGLMGFMPMGSGTLSGMCPNHRMVRSGSILAVRACFVNVSFPASAEIRSGQPCARGGHRQACRHWRSQNPRSTTDLVILLAVGQWLGVIHARGIRKAWSLQTLHRRRRPQTGEKFRLRRVKPHQKREWLFLDR